MINLILLTMASTSLIGQSKIDMTRIDLISKRMQSFVDESRIPGCVTLVMHGGKTVHENAVGFADRASNLKLNIDSLFQVMSMTKPVTAIAIMMLVDDGLVNLNDPIDRFLPGFSAMKVEIDENGNKKLVDSRRKILVRHLLTHMSGFSSSDPPPLTDDMKWKLTLAEVVERISNAPLVSEPGTRVSYSGLGFSVAGRIVEIASGKRFDAFLDERLFVPLGMQDTHFFLPKDKQGRLAKVYYRESGKLALLDEDPFRPGAKLANPAGGLYSTARDMAAILRMMLNKGVYRSRRILSQRSVETMTQIQSLPPGPNSTESTAYGYGWAVTSGPSNSATLMEPGVFGHSGAFGTYFWADPASNVCAVFLTQILGGDGVVTDTFRSLVNTSIQR